jgi:hypothetical protein
MVSRLLANLSIQKTIDHPPVSDSGWHPTNAPDKQVTNGVVGSRIGRIRDTNPSERKFP